MVKGWKTAKCGHIVELKNAPCSGCEPEKAKKWWQEYYDKKKVSA